MDINAYLDRLAHAGPVSASSATLSALHLAHLFRVPFENLDIGRRPIVLDEAAFFSKIVQRWRGGFCYELNGLFAALLREPLPPSRVRCPLSSVGTFPDNRAEAITSWQSLGVTGQKPPSWRRRRA